MTRDVRTSLIKTAVFVVLVWLGFQRIPSLLWGEGSLFFGIAVTAGITFLAYLFNYQAKWWKFILFFIAALFVLISGPLWIRTGIFVGPLCLGLIFYWLTRDKKVIHVDHNAQDNPDPEHLWIERIGNLSDDRIVKGAWEWVEMTLRGLGNDKTWIYDKSVLAAYWIGLTDKELVIGSRYVNEWNDLTEVTPEQLKHVSSIPLSDIRSLELSNMKEFDGNDWKRSFLAPVLPQVNNKKIAQKHSEMVNLNKYAQLQLRWDNVWIVYVFTKEGERVKITQTFSRDFAIKTHAKLGFMLEDAGLATARKNTQSGQDYL